MGQHDSGYHLLFSYPYLVECLLKGFVPGSWIDHLDFKGLETVREAHPRDNIGMRYDDMIWRLRWQDRGLWVYIYLLLEFQSTDEPFMAIRLQDYVAGLYRQIVRTLKPKRGEPLPIVLPIVLYRGQPAWTSPTDIFDLIGPAPPEVEPYLPHQRFLLLDASALEPEQLEAMRNPVACLLRLEGSRKLETKPIDELDKLLAAPEQAGLRRACSLWLTQVFLPSRLPDVTVPEVKKLEEVSPMIAEHTIDWSTQWRREGEEKGRQKGEATLLLRQLTRKYGSLAPELRERVRTADSKRLLEWADRFVTATSLDEVFQEEPPERP